MPFYAPSVKTINPAENGGRLTLTSGTPVTTSDVTAATTVYYTPFKSDITALYTGTNWIYDDFSEMSISVPSTTNTNFDLFLDYNDGSPQLASTNWSNNTTRATAITRQNGVFVKSGDTQQRYLGTGRTTGTTGQTESSEDNKRFLWNYSNRIQLKMKVIETTSSWTTNVTTFRPYNNSTDNRVEFVRGVDDDVVTILALGGVATENLPPDNDNGFVGLAIDATNTNDADASQGGGSGNGRPLLPTNAMYKKFLTAGYHFAQMTERTQLGKGCFFFGNTGGVGDSGIVGHIMG